MPIRIEVDATEAIAGLRDFEQSQLPYALASTLTAVAKDAQTAVRANVRKAFTLRNTWTERGIRIKPADKAGRKSNGLIEADVHTDAANRKTGAGDYLVRQEDGGERVPVNGRHHIAVPTKYFRRRFPGVIPAELRPAALLGVVGGRFLTHTRKGQIALRNSRLVRGYVFFLQEMHDGRSAIMGRPPNERDAAPFYLLIPEAQIKKSGLEMVETVTKTAEQQFPVQWQQVWTKIRLRGIRIRL